MQQPERLYRRIETSVPKPMEAAAQFQQLHHFGGRRGKDAGAIKLAQCRFRPKQAENTFEARHLDYHPAQEALRLCRVLMIEHKRCRRAECLSPPDNGETEAKPLSGKSGRPAKAAMSVMKRRRPSLLSMIMRPLRGRIVRRLATGAKNVILRQIVEFHDFAAVLADELPCCRLLGKGHGFLRAHAAAQELPITKKALRASIQFSAPGFSQLAALPISDT